MRRDHRAAVVLAAAWLAAGTTAHAEEPRPASPGPRTPTPVVPLTSAAPAPARVAWYGWQILAMDAASLTARAFCQNRVGSDDSGCNLALAGYGLGSPIIHGAHRGWPRALTSAVLRIGLPLAGNWFWKPAESCKWSSNSGITLCGAEEAGLGIFIGFAAAMMIDSIWAFDDSRAPPQPPARTAATIAPTLTFNRDTTIVGLGARF